MWDLKWLKLATGLCSSAFYDTLKQMKKTTLCISLQIGLKESIRRAEWKKKSTSAYLMSNTKPHLLRKQYCPISKKKKKRKGFQWAFPPNRRALPQSPSFLKFSGKEKISHFISCQSWLLWKVIIETVSFWWVSASYLHFFFLVDTKKFYTSIVKSMEALRYKTTCCRPHRWDLAGLPKIHLVGAYVVSLHGSW